VPTQETLFIELKRTVYRLLTTASLVTWAGAADAWVMVVLDVFLAILLAAWCAPLVIDSINRALDEHDAGRTRRRRRRRRLENSGK
jgi:hypothetical protein